MKNPAEKLRSLADAMQSTIDAKLAPMTQNFTPKRGREYNVRVHDGHNLERAQAALRVLADAHERGTVPEILADVRTKVDVCGMTATRGDTAGYYDYRETNEYRDKSDKAVALRKLVEASNSTHEAAEKERREARRLQELLDGIRGLDIPGFFPTPRPVAELMLKRGGVVPNHTILEPSAGIGSLADVIREQNADAFLTCVEIAPRLTEVLNAKGYLVDSEPDFLKCAPVRPFDRILMNPPFENGQDAQHIRHAFDCLSPGGIVVSLCSPGPLFRSDRKSQEFRDFLALHDAEVEDLPDNSFNHADAFRRTGIACKMLTINKAA